eukprot:TRINITY_DN2013_c0_g1_i6.p1 TRINITY_DN2013_c0_g1~~TRINITY_DN2013_c0_g1_i6.p1  ORF type:complete len:1263 (-),score=165.61 TRINITY_DN2013_c0_g1_i6:42-3830(-)
MVGCENYLDSTLIMSESDFTYSSQYCFSSPGTTEWEQDGCCNPLLVQWGDNCCHSRNVTNSIQEFTNVIPKVTKGCATPLKSSDLLQDYISLRNLFLDPVQGCTVSAEAWANYKTLDGKLEELYICFNTLVRIFNQSLVSLSTGVITQISCSSDRDCYCSKCDILEGVCGYCNLESTMASLESCFQFNHSIPVYIVNLAKISWNLTNANDSQFYSDFFNRTKVNQCLSHDSVIHQELNETECTRLGFCKDTSNTNLVYPQTTQSSCSSNNFSGVCEVCSNEGSCSKLPFGDTCIINDQQIISQSLCERIGYVWNTFENFCFANLLQNDCECGTGFSNYSLCLSGYCIDSSSLTMQQCTVDQNSDLSYRYWDTTLNSCIYEFPYKSICNNNGGTWIEGKYWRPRNNSQFNINSQSDCENLDLCLVNNKLQIGNCNSSFNCIGRCPACQSSFGNPIGVCYSNTINNRIDCVNNNGSWESTDNICIVNIFDKNSCTSSGGVWESCSELSYSSCDACYNGFNNCTNKAVNSLSCYWNSKKLCDQSLNSNDCSSQQFCHKMDDYPACAYITSSIDTFGCPICSYQLKVPYLTGYNNVARMNNSYGNLTGIDSSDSAVIEAFDLYSIYGCINKNVKKEECLANLGLWIDPYFTESSCTSLKGCSESLENNNCFYKVDYSVATNDGYTNKSQAECVDCGGSYKSVYEWRSAQMVQATKFKTVWKTDIWESVYSYVPFLSPDLLSQALLKYLFVHPQLSILSAIECEASPIYNTAGIYYCDCNNATAKRGRCFPTNQISYLGSQLFCRGENTTIRLGKTNLFFNEESVPAETYCTELSVSSLGATQFQNSQLVGSSALLGSLSHRDIPYAIIKNSKGFIVGQLLTDGIRMTFQQSSLVSKRDISPATNNNFTICIDKRSDIKNNDKIFPFLDFAYSDDLINFYPMNTSVTLVHGAYCGIISTKTATIFAVSLVKNWQTISSIFVGNEDVKNVLFAMSAFMFLLFVGCVASIIFHFSQSQDFSISKAALIFIMIYAALRAVFFLLFAIGALDKLAKGNNPGYFILAELPYYVFLSIFILVVVCWVVMSSTSSKNVLKRLFYPLLITNILLYTLFIIVLIVSSTVTNDGAVIFNKVYKCIVAFIALCIVVFAIIFGTIFLINMFRSLKLSNKSVPKNLLKTTVILFITAIALLLQIAYLLYSAFSKGNISFAVTDYFLMEVVPVIILFFLFTFTKIRGKGSRSSKNSMNKTMDPHKQRIKNEKTWSNKLLKK